jgi:hypothetical protein
VSRLFTIALLTLSTLALGQNDPGVQLRTPYQVLEALGALSTENGRDCMRTSVLCYSVVPGELSLIKEVLGLGSAQWEVTTGDDGRNTHGIKLESVDISVSEVLSYEWLVMVLYSAD